MLLGPKWTESAPVLRLLAPTVFVFALVNPFGWFLQATGRVRRSLNIAILIAPVVILGIGFGLPFGPAGVATGYSAAMLLLVWPVIAWSKLGTGITALDIRQGAADLRLCFDCWWLDLQALLLG
jgi:PST family polysaccharide transporter